MAYWEAPSTDGSYCSQKVVAPCASMASAINIFKSVIALALLFMANFASRKLTDNGLF